MSSLTGPAPPTGFVSGTSPKFYDVSTTAGFDGDAQVCIEYATNEFTGPTPASLWQYDTQAGEWADITSGGGNHTACGTTTSLGEFALFTPPPPPPPAFVLSWGELGVANGQLYGLAVDASGDVYVVDDTHGLVEKYDAYGNLLTTIGDPSGPGHLTAAREVAVDSSGNVYVVDGTRVAVFDNSGTFVRDFGSAQLQFPSGVGVDPLGNVFVGDPSTSQITKFDSSGSFVTAWGAAGHVLSGPQGVAVDSSGNVYVADTGHNRVKKFDGDGNLLATFGSPGEDDGHFNRVYGVAVDLDGNVYATDDGDHDQVLEFAPDGTFLTRWGSNGTGNGQFQVPYGVAADQDGNVYVTDFNNRRVQKFSSFSYGEPTQSGLNVVVSPVDPYTGTAPTTITFDDVNTTGTTSVTSSTSGPPVPAGFALGYPPSTTSPRPRATTRSSRCASSTTRTRTPTPTRSRSSTTTHRRPRGTTSPIPPSTP